MQEEAAEKIDAGVRATLVESANAETRSMTLRPPKAQSAEIPERSTWLASHESPCADVDVADNSLGLAGTTEAGFAQHYTSPARPPSAAGSPKASAARRRSPSPRDSSWSRCSGSKSLYACSTQVLSWPRPSSICPESIPE